MSTVALVDCGELIGQTAGKVWHFLEDNGPMSVSKLVKAIDCPRDNIMQAIGWLAREDKVNIEEVSRGRIISLR